jgi:fatty-acyl-CoA synthase
MEGLMMPFPLTISQFVDRAERLFPTVEVVSRRSDGSVSRSTYAATVERARRLAGALRAEGLQPGDRVATLLWNEAVNLETYFGVPMVRGVLVPLNFRLQPSELEFILTQSRPRWLVVDRSLWPLFEKIRQAVPNAAVRVVGPAGPDAPRGLTDYETWISAAEPQPSSPDIEEDDAAALFYTTGTTGRSKGILYSHRSTVLHTLVFALTFEMSHRDVICPIVSMSHAHGCGMPHAAPLLGAKIVLPGPPSDPAALLTLFEQEGVTFTGAVPGIWSGIFEALEKEPTRWRLAPGFRCLVGGSAVPETMFRQFDKFGLRATQIWGMTEMSPLATASRPKQHLEALSPDALYALRASQGFPVPFVEVRTRPDPRFRVRDDGTEGELEVRGPWIARAYYERPGPGDRWTADGWFRTGDLASIDREGYVRITDRIGDLVKVGELWASSLEVEERLMDHPAVRDAAVVAYTTPESGEHPHAVVVLREGSHASVGELDRFLWDRLPEDWRPASYSFIGSLPRTGVGKVSKQSLREQLAAGTLPVLPVDAPRPPST